MFGQWISDFIFFCFHLFWVCTCLWYQNCRLFSFRPITSWRNPLIWPLPIDWPSIPELSIGTCPYNVFISFPELWISPNLFEWLFQFFSFPLIIFWALDIWLQNLRVLQSFGFKFLYQFSVSLGFGLLCLFFLQ